MTDRESFKNEVKRFMVEMNEDAFQRWLDEYVDQLLEKQIAERDQKELAFDIADANADLCGYFVQGPPEQQAS